MKITPTRMRWIHKSFIIIIKVSFPYPYTEHILPESSEHIIPRIHITYKYSIPIDTLSIIVLKAVHHLGRSTLITRPILLQVHTWVWAGRVTEVSPQWYRIINWPGRPKATCNYTSCAKITVVNWPGRGLGRAVWAGPGGVGWAG